MRNCSHFYGSTTGAKPPVAQLVMARSCGWSARLSARLRGGNRRQPAAERIARRFLEPSDVQRLLCVEADGCNVIDIVMYIYIYSQLFKDLKTHSVKLLFSKRGQGAVTLTLAGPRVDQRKIAAMKVPVVIFAAGYVYGDVTL